MKAELESVEDAAARLATQALTPGERVRLWERLEASRSATKGRRRRVLALAFALGTTLLAVASFLLWIRKGAPEIAAPAKTAACTLDGRLTELELPASCTAQSVSVAGDEWRLSPGAALRRAEGGARLDRGAVRFRVRPRSNTRFSVFVSHGEIRVIGTAFEVDQKSNAGSVSVSEGVIEFVWNDGVRERVVSGQTLRWPRPTSSVKPAPSVMGPRTAASSEQGTRTVPDGGASPDSRQSQLDMNGVLERLLQLKSQQRFTEAIALLQKTLAAPGLNGLQRERLSYELGLALEASGRPACAHWERHIEGFGSARHSAALARRLQRCKK